MKTIKRDEQLRRKIRQIFLKIFLKTKCFLTGGHKFSPNEWGFCCGNNVVEYFCTKCFTPIKRVALDDFEKKEFLFCVLHREKNSNPE